MSVKRFAVPGKVNAAGTASVWYCTGNERVVSDAPLPTSFLKQHTSGAHEVPLPNLARGEAEVFQLAIQRPEAAASGRYHWSLTPFTTAAGGSGATPPVLSLYRAQYAFAQVAGQNPTYQYGSQVNQPYTRRWRHTDNPLQLGQWVADRLVPLQFSGPAAGPLDTTTFTLANQNPKIPKSDGEWSQTQGSPVSGYKNGHEHNVVFVVEVDVPRDATPGTYQATLTLVDVDGSKSNRFVLSLRVRHRAFTLPETSDFALRLPVTVDNISLAVLREDKPWLESHLPKFNDIFNTLYRHRMEPRHFTGRSGAMGQKPKIVILGQPLLLGCWRSRQQDALRKNLFVLQNLYSIARAMGSAGMGARHEVAPCHLSYSNSPEAGKAVVYPYTKSGVDVAEPFASKNDSKKLVVYSSVGPVLGQDAKVVLTDQFQHVQQAIQAEIARTNPGVSTQPA